MNALIPNTAYFLKWSTVIPPPNPPQIHNMVVLKGEFIKLYNNEYREHYNNYKNSDVAPSHELIGPILTVEDENEIIYPFNHSLYPYSSFNTDSFNIGLFKIISIEKSIFKGIEQPFRDNNPYRFVTLSANTLIDTPPRIIYNETFMWVNLDRVAIMPAINKLKLLQEKAVNTIGLPDDIKSYIKTALGGNRRKKHNKTRIRKTKRKKQKTQTVRV